MVDEWFRSPGWSPDDRAAFEQRLSRARRTSRAQYLRIKGLALMAAGESDGARSLWLRVLDEEADAAGLQSASTLEHLGDLCASEDPRAALDFYERSLEGLRLGRGTTGSQHVKMARLLLRDPTTANVERAADLLARWSEETRLPFPSAHFDWNLAVIEVAEVVGDPTTARDAARRALDLAGRGPAFSRHPTVGVVQTDPATLRRLTRLAG